MMEGGVRKDWEDDDDWGDMLGGRIARSGIV